MGASTEATAAARRLDSTLPFSERVHPKLHAPSFFSTSDRIGLHPEIGNAYALLSLIDILSRALENGLSIKFTDDQYIKPYQGTEQELMESLFLELFDENRGFGPTSRLKMEEQGYKFFYFFQRYQHLAFIRNLRARADFQELMKENISNESRQRSMQTLNQYLIEQLRLMGIRWDIPVFGSLNNDQILRKEQSLSTQTHIILSAMNRVLVTYDNQKLIHCKAMFWSAVDMVLGFWLLSTVLASMPSWSSAHPLLIILDLFIVAAAIYFIDKALPAFITPSFREHLSSQPSYVNEHSIVIDKNTLAVKNGIFLSYNFSGKTPLKVEKQQGVVPQNLRPAGTYAVTS